MINNKKSKMIGIMLLVSILTISTLTIATPNINNYLNYGISNLYTKSFDDNTPPDPPIISGPTTGKTGKYYEYSFTLTDVDEDDFLSVLEVDFGNSIEGAIKKNCEHPWYNGTVININHKWNEQGEYPVTARVMDSYGAWSNWSSPFNVSIPKNKQINYLLIQLLDEHSEFLSIIRKFLG